MIKHALTSAYVDICSPNTSVEKKQSQQKRLYSKVLSFHLYFFARKKNELVL